jgi:hypothetical protein
LAVAVIKPQTTNDNKHRNETRNSMGCKLSCANRAIIADEKICKELLESCVDKKNKKKRGGVADDQLIAALDIKVEDLTTKVDDLSRQMMLQQQSIPVATTWESEPAGSPTKTAAEEEEDKKR